MPAMGTRGTSVGEGAGAAPGEHWVLVTRADDELAEYRDALGAVGLAVRGWPVLCSAPLPDGAGWAAAEAVRERLAAVAFTSPRAPAALRAVAAQRGIDAALVALPAFAVGDATARAAEAAGFAVAAVGRAGGAALAGLIAARLGAGAAVLHACGREHRPDLATALAAAGVDVAELVVYAMDATPPASLPPLPDDPPAAVLLTSPRAAEAYRDAAGPRLRVARHLAMGETTAAHARALGIDVTVLRRPTADAVVEELCQTCS
jgi:uroporphyrinogen-III synthase